MGTHSIAARRRVEVPYVWPKALVRPSSAVRIVYLDQKDWIDLARADSGHPEGVKYRGALDALRDAHASGRVLFPLSLTHIMETAGISQSRQRAAVAKVMEELSGFATLVPREVVMRMELESVLDTVARRRPQRYAPVPLIGHGTPFAYGKTGKFRVRSGGGADVTDEVRQRFPGGADAFDRFVTQAERDLDRGVLRGPADAAEAAKLKEHGWNPRVARTIAEDRAKQEREQAARFDDKTLVPDDETDWRRERIRDVIRVQYVIVELMEMLTEALQARGLEIDDVWSDVDSSRAIVDAMPSADVCVSLKTEYYRNRQTRWTPNDIFDIDALSVAVPYCDIVVTDKHAWNSLHAAGLPKRFGATVLAKLADLADLLAS